MTSIPQRPFTVREARSWGVSKSDLAHLLQTHQIRRELHGVYTPNEVEDSLLIRAQAVGLAAPDHVVICDRTAAWIYGVDRYEHSQRKSPPPVDAVSIDGNNRLRRRGMYGARRTLSPEDVTEIEGIRCTTPVRTAADLACLHGRLDAMATLDMFLRVGGVDAAELAAILPRFAGRRGVVQLRELAPLAIAEAESQPESWVRMLILDDGMPAPEAQYWVLDGERPLFRLDLAYPELKIAVEYDGEEFHSTAAQRSRDRTRRTWLRAQGWHVIVVRKEDLSAEQRRVWLDQLRSEINERRPKTHRRYAKGGRFTGSNWPSDWPR